MDYNRYFDFCLEHNKVDCRAGEVGAFKVFNKEMPAGSTFIKVPKIHTAKLLGMEYTTIKLEKPYNSYELWSGSELVMSNVGTDIFEHYFHFRRAQGNILMAGLGLLWFPRLLLERGGIESITIVENSKDVIEMCWKEVPKVKLIEADFYEWMKKNDLSGYDYIYIDTYTPNIETYKNIIVPTRKFLIENFPYVQADFWYEDELKARYLLEENK